MDILQGLSRLQRGGGSVVVNPDGTISAVGDTDITGDLILTGGVVYGALIGSDVAGAIEWDGSNFRGYTGAAWVALDVQATSGGGWTDDGTVVRLTLASDDVHIGAATAPGAKLKITGTLITTDLATLASADINGGTIDGTAIGGAVRAAGSFTTGTFSGLLTAESGVTIDTATYGRTYKNAVSGLTIRLTTGSSYDLEWLSRAGGSVLRVTTGSAVVTFVQEIFATAGVRFGTTVDLTEGAADLLALAAGDSFHIVSGAMGIGAVPSANADLLLEAGRLMLKESVTPTADTNYGKVYTKTDNKLYFQDGAGVEHEVSLV